MILQFLMKPIDEEGIKDFPQLANMSTIELCQDDKLFLNSKRASRRVQKCKKLKMKNDTDEKAELKQTILEER